jgi:putative membrane protein
MKSTSAIALTTALLMLFTLPAAASSLSQSDESYLNSEMQTALGRYALASLAQKQASSPNVKQLAQNIQTQSSTESQHLEKIAKQYGVSPPKSPSVRDSYHYSQLTGLHGKAFDQQFVQELTVDDDIVSGNNQSEAQSGQNPQLKAIAKQQYATLQHEKQALSQIHS